jgi:uncharacterized membrane protein YfcA
MCPEPMAPFPWLDAAIIAGLILGGVIAAPFAAKLCKILPAKVMMRLVGILLIVVSAHTLLRATGKI